MQRPRTEMGGDITYLATSEGWLYLAVIIDLYSRQVIGWSMDSRMTEHWSAMHYQWLCSVEASQRK